MKIANTKTTFQTHKLCIKARPPRLQSGEENEETFLKNEVTKKLSRSGCSLSHGESLEAGSKGLELAHSFDPARVVATLLCWVMSLLQVKPVAGS